MWVQTLLQWPCHLKHGPRVPLARGVPGRWELTWPTQKYSLEFGGVHAPGATLSQDVMRATALILLEDNFGRNLGCTSELPVGSCPSCHGSSHPIHPPFITSLIAPVSLSPSCFPRALTPSSWDPLQNKLLALKSLFWTWLSGNTNQDASQRGKCCIAI